MLTAPCVSRIRAAVAPPSEVSLRIRLAEFLDCLDRAWPDVAVVDPTLLEARGKVALALERARTPAVLYVYLTPAHARATVDFVRRHPARVVAFGHGDDLQALVAALAQTGRAARGSAFLEHLSAQLQLVPAYVAKGIQMANDSCTRILSVVELAAFCGTHRATLARTLARAGIRSSSLLVAALGMAQHFDMLSDPTLSPVTVARRLGLGSARALERRCRALSGFRLCDVRCGITLAEFCSACATQLVRAAD